MCDEAELLRRYFIEADGWELGESLEFSLEEHCRGHDTKRAAPGVTDSSVEFLLSSINDDCEEDPLGR